LQDFDIQGSLVKTLVNDYPDAGSYSVNWNAGNLNLSSGIYYAKLISGAEIQTIKISLMKEKVFRRTTRTVVLHFIIPAWCI
jgi:hypothetical protein